MDSRLTVEPWEAPCIVEYNSRIRRRPTTTSGAQTKGHIEQDASLHNTRPGKVIAFYRFLPH